MKGVLSFEVFKAVCYRKVRMEKDMSIYRIVTASVVLAGASTAVAQSVPTLNPVYNPDNTYTWYVGGSTVYPNIQAVLDVAAPGDEIVITTGLYVESLSVNTPDLTIRPRVQDVAGSGGSSTVEWDAVTLWNPADTGSDFAIKLGTNTNNTYIGRPRQFTQLSSGATVETEIIPGEYNWDGVAGTEAALSAISVASGSATGKVLNFWSRSQDDVAVWSDGGQGTLMSCSFRGQNGFGGAILCTAPTVSGVVGTNTTSFVDCEIKDLNAPGNTMSGYPICAITLQGSGMNVYFSKCIISGCTSGALGAVYQNGGTSYWAECEFNSNNCYPGNGTVNILNANPMFTNCKFDQNNSRYGTVYLDSTGMGLDEITSFYKCEFTKNLTQDTLSGGCFVADDSASNGSPLVSFDACTIKENNTAASDEMSSYDIETPYFPEYRIGMDLNDTATNNSGPSTVAGDLNDDGVVNGADMGILLGNWGLGG